MFSPDYLMICALCFAAVIFVIMKIVKETAVDDEDGGLNQWNDSREQRTENIKQIKAKKAELEQELALEQHQEMIANKRYKSCIPVVGEIFKNGTHYFTGINETTIARDRITGKTLPPNTIICDANGMTARVSDNGKPTAFAYTGDRDIIQSRLKRFRGSQYSNPILIKE